MNHLLVVFALVLATSTSFGQSENLTNYFTQTEINMANTATTTDYLNQEEKDIFLYNNLARMFPKKFYNLYRDYCKEGYRSEYFASDHYYTTLSKDLLNRQPSGALLPDRKMFELAECWALESGEKGIVGHDRQECVGGYSGENCAYGTTGGFAIVMQLLIDYGVESLGHRSNMLSPSWKGLGTAVRQHSVYGTCAVQDFTGTNDVLRAEAARKRAEDEAKEAERQRLLSLRAEEYHTLMAKWSKTEIENADAARSLSYLNDFEKDLYFYINLVRLYPKKFKTLIWDNGPFFDQFLAEQQSELHRESAYRTVAQTLGTAKGGVAFIPDQKAIEAARCTLAEYQKNRSNPVKCYLPVGFHSWRLRGMNLTNNYDDIMSIFLTPNDFKEIFFSNAVVIVDDLEDSGNTLVLLKK